MAGDIWPSFEPAISPLLTQDDDAALWASVVNVVYSDAHTLCQSVAKYGRVLTQLGCCSHWLRPHQTRWSAGGGFAWPTGYGGPNFSRAGLPEYDWFVQWTWCPESNSWARSFADPSSDQLVFRVTVPARTRFHRQAAVHSIWHPGSPLQPQIPLTQFYGFRAKSDSWFCTAYRASPNDRVYELVAENSEVLH